ITSTHQLAYLLHVLSKASSIPMACPSSPSSPSSPFSPSSPSSPAFQASATSLDDDLDEAHRLWVQAIVADVDEQTRLQSLAIKVVEEFIDDGFKDFPVVAEVVCL